MDEELEKDPAEMDTELVDLCVETLEEGYREAQQETHSGKPKRKNLRKVLLFAAIVVIFLAVALTVGAGLNKNPVSDGFVKYTPDHYEIDLRGGLTGDETTLKSNAGLVPALRELGFDDIVLPSGIFQYSYSDIVVQEAEYIMGVSIKLQDPQSGIKGYISIDRYDELISDIAGKGKNPDTDYRVEQFSVNGLDVLLFYNENRISIEYLDNLTEYMIYLDNCDYETAVAIIMSLQ